MPDADFALFNVSHLVTVAPGVHAAATGDLGVIDRAALAAQDGKIVWVGPMEELREQVDLAPSATILNTHGRTVLPGFVDPHTHPVFAGNRSGDFYARALGADYGQQLKTGGIMETVRATRAAPEDTLLDLAYARADCFLRYGTTTIEAKTGYGLTRGDELKSLQVLNRLQRIHHLKVVPAYLAAHIVPHDFDGDADAYVDEVIAWLPEAVGRASFVDVWFDEGAFAADQGRRILERARELGLELTAHANELGPHAGLRVAAELGARSVDHVDFLDAGDIEALQRSGTVAVLLPGTMFFLGHDHYAPARDLIDAGVTVALGTDFNPGTSNTQNMQFILTLAILKLKMTPEEAIRAATINAAKALDLDDCTGSLEPGKYADFAVYQVDHYRDIPYQYAMNQVQMVVSCGEIVMRDGDIVVPRRPPAYAS